MMVGFHGGHLKKTAVRRNGQEIKSHGGWHFPALHTSLCAAAQLPAMACGIMP
jgi:hypothetical protein